MAVTTITVIPSQNRKHADLCKSQTKDGKRITVWKNHKVCWVSDGGDLKVDFSESKSSPFKSGRKHMKAKKGQPTGQEETRDLKVKEKFRYTGTVLNPDGTVLWQDCDLEVDPGPGPIA